MLTLILICASVSVAAAGVTCPPDSFDAGGKCCKLCPPGRYYMSACTNTTESVCKDCPENTFLAKRSQARKCDRCKRCLPSQITVVPCSATSNTNCSCRTGKYLDPGLLFCMECELCDRGYGATIPCTTDENAKCGPCLQGTFSNVKSRTEPCQKCKRCEFGYTVSVPCTAQENTVCLKMNISSTTSGPSFTSPQVSRSSPGGSSSSFGSRNPGNHQEWFVPVMVVIGAVFVLFVLGGILWCFRKSLPCRRTPQDDGLPQFNGAVGSGRESAMIPLNPVEESPHQTSRANQHRGLRGRHKQSLRRTNGTRDSTDSDLQGDKPRMNGKVNLFRDLPCNVTDSLARHLNPSSKNDWTRLASHLGYTSTDVANWKLNPQESTQSLLYTWQTKDSSTVETIYHILRDMKRDDAACELKDYR